MAYSQARLYVDRKVPISKYYDERIIPMDRRRFFRGGLSVNNMTICPLHEDTDPSFGLMKDKFHPDIMLYHCFGCGAVGDLVRLHQRVEFKYHNRDLNENEAILDLASIFPEIKLEEVVLIDESESFARMKHSLVSITQNQSRYTIRDMQADLKEVRKRQFHMSYDDVARRTQASILKLMVTNKDMLV